MQHQTVKFHDKSNLVMYVINVCMLDVCMLDVCMLDVCMLDVCMLDVPANIHPEDISAHLTRTGWHTVMEAADVPCYLQQ